MNFIKIDNREKSAIKSGRWRNPGASLYNKLLSASCGEGQNYDSWGALIKEAYLVAPVEKISNDPRMATPYSRSGCKYPHHVIKNNKLVLSLAGVKAAYARAKQQGIYKCEVKDHLDRHMKELGLLDKEDVHYESIIEDNFIDIESFLMEKSNIDLSDDIIYSLNEKSHGKLKYDYRVGYDADTGHKILLVYSLDNINVDYPGHAYEIGGPNDKYSSDSKYKDSIKDVTANIRKKGNIDHSSYGQKLLAIKDLVTNKPLKEVNYVGIFKGLNSFGSSANGDKQLSAEGLKKTLQSTTPLHIKVAEVETDTTFKSTKIIDSFDIMAKSELSDKYGRGHKINTQVMPGIYKTPTNKDAYVNMIKYVNTIVYDRNIRDGIKMIDDWNNGNVELSLQGSAKKYKITSSIIQKYIDKTNLRMNQIPDDKDFFNKELNHLTELQNHVKQQGYIESTDIFIQDDIDDYSSDEYITEKSHSKLKYCYRVGFDATNGKEVAIEFDLDSSKITGIGDERNIQYALNKTSNTSTANEIRTIGLDTTKRNIASNGYIDFTTDELRVSHIFYKGGDDISSVTFIPLFSKIVVDTMNSMTRIIFKKYNKKVSSRELFEMEEFQENLVARLKVYSDQFENYQVGEYCGKGKYKTTKLLWDRDMLLSYKYTPVLRGYNNPGRGENVVDMQDYLRNNLNNKFESTSDGDVAIFNSMISESTFWGESYDTITIPYNTPIEAKYVTHDEDGYIECVLDNIVNGVYHMNEPIDEEFTEKSHGKLKSSFRVAVNVENGHFIKIVFDLKPDQVLQIGDHANQFGRNHVRDITIKNNIQKTGHNDFSSIGIVKAIVDMDTKQSLKSVKTIGVIGSNTNTTRFKVPTKYIDSKLGDNATSFNAYPVATREKIAKELNLTNAPDAITFTVGKREERPSYKATTATNSVSQVFHNQWTQGRGYIDPNKALFGSSNKMSRSNMNINTAIKMIENRYNKIKPSAMKLADVDDDIAYYCKTVERGINRLKRLAEDNKGENYGQTISDVKYSRVVNTITSTICDIEEEINENKNESFMNESIDDIPGTFMEKSHGKLKYDFRSCYDIDTGHALKVVYSLDNIEVTNTGRTLKGELSDAEKNDEVSTTQRVISKTGHLDHQSKGQKVLAIVDRVTGKNLTSARVIGVFAPGIKNNVLDQHDAFGKNWKINDSGMMKKYIYDIHVGDVETSPTFKSTHWFKDDTKISPRTGKRFDNTTVRLSQAEELNQSRGSKLNDFHGKPTLGLGKMPIKYNHPSKKDIKKNPDLYKGVITESTKVFTQGDFDKYSKDIPEDAYIDPEEGEIDNILEWMDSVIYGDLFEEKKTHEEYAREHFKKKYKYDPQTSILEETGRTPESIYEWMHNNIEYDKASPSEWRLKTVNDTYCLNKGNCHDQSLFASTLLHSLGYITNQIFFIEYKDGSNVGGNTHTLTWYKDNGKIYWFENAWEDQAGIHGPYNSIDELEKDLYNIWSKDNDLNSHEFDGIMFSDNVNYCIGMTLGEYVESWKPFYEIEPSTSIDNGCKNYHNESGNVYKFGSVLFENGEFFFEADDAPPPIDDETENDDPDKKDQTEKNDNDDEGKSEETPAESDDSTTDDVGTEPEQPDQPEETNSDDTATEDSPKSDDKAENTPEEPSTQTDEDSGNKPVDDKSLSYPKQTDAAESSKNGVRRKKLYIAFIEWCKEYNNRNTFGSIFDKDVFKVSYPFIPDPMRYFYRLANPMLCVLGGQLTFFPVAELGKVNSGNKDIYKLLIFAATPKDLRVFNKEDNKVYRGTEVNNSIQLNEVLGETFDLYIQKMIGKGDILNAPLEEDSNTTE